MFELLLGLGALLMRRRLPRKPVLQECSSKSPGRDAPGLFFQSGFLSRTTRLGEPGVGSYCDGNAVDPWMYTLSSGGRGFPVHRAAHCCADA